MTSAALSRSDFARCPPFRVTVALRLAQQGLERRYASLPKADVTIGGSEDHGKLIHLSVRRHT
jgi:hypothetical protein